MRAIYISGKMSGLKDYNYDAFKKAEEELKEKFPDKIIINPMNIILKMYSMEELRKGAYNYDLILDNLLQILVNDVDALYLLKDWNNSNGAKQELKKAIELNYQILLE